MRSGALFDNLEVSFRLLPIRRGWQGGPLTPHVNENDMSVTIALLSIAVIGVFAYLMFDCLIPKDPPDGERPPDS